MARNPPDQALPDPLTRRDVLYAEPPDRERLAALGRLYREEGRLDDACQFFLKAGDEAALTELLAGAIQRGDTPLAWTLAKSGREVVAADWEELGDAALAADRPRYALAAFERAGAEGKAAAVRARLFPPAPRADSES